MDIEKSPPITIQAMTEPYTEEILEQHGTGVKFKIRTFSEGVDMDELVWHRDREHRTIHVLEGEGWKLQHDDKLPMELEVGKDYYIPKMSYHRVIKGLKRLVLRIQIT